MKYEIGDLIHNSWGIWKVVEMDEVFIEKDGKKIYVQLVSNSMYPECNKRIALRDKLSVV